MGRRGEQGRGVPCLDSIVGAGESEGSEGVVMDRELVLPS